MEEQEILKGNKLIGEFLELPLNHKQLMYDSNVYYDVTSFHPWMSAANIHQFAFHSSWDWLIPVVQKIIFDNENNEFTDTVFYRMLSTTLSFKNGKEIVYEKVIQFIKFYNKKNKTQRK